MTPCRRNWHRPLQKSGCADRYNLSKIVILSAKISSGEVALHRNGTVGADSPLHRLHNRAAPLPFRPQTQHKAA